MYVLDDVMFPFDIMTPLPPALLSPISFNVALQQLFNSVSLLLAHQHALVLNLSVSHAPDPVHLIPTQSLSQSQSYFRSYADALKSSTSSIPRSSPRSSFTIRQITPIETVVLTPKESRSRSTTPRMPNSPRTPASEPKPQPKPEPELELELISNIRVQEPESTPSTATATATGPAPPIAPTVVATSPSIVDVNPDQVIIVSNPNPLLDTQLPMDEFSISIRKRYLPVTPLCCECELFPTHCPDTDDMCIPCMFRNLPSNYNEHMMEEYGITEQENQLLKLYFDVFRYTSLRLVTERGKVKRKGQYYNIIISLLRMM